MRRRASRPRARPGEPRSPAASRPPSRAARRLRACRAVRRHSRLDGLVSRRAAEIALIVSAAAYMVWRLWTAARLFYPPDATRTPGPQRSAPPRPPASRSTSRVLRSTSHRRPADGALPTASKSRRSQASSTSGRHRASRCSGLRALTATRRLRVFSILRDDARVAPAGAGGDRR